MRKIDATVKAAAARAQTATCAQSGRYSVVVNGSRYNVEVSEGFSDDIEIKSVTPAGAAPQASAASANSDASSEAVTASLPGVVHKILVKAGDSVKKGQAVFVLEAMKMEIEIPAPNDGVIASIEVSQGQSVENGQILARM